MEREPTAASQETSQLLQKLDELIEQSSVLQEIVRLGEKLRRLEQVAGPCHQSEIIRRQIALKESELHMERSDTGSLKQVQKQ